MNFDAVSKNVKSLKIGSRTEVMKNSSNCWSQNHKTAVLYNTVDFRKSEVLYNTAVFLVPTTAISQKICGIVTQICGIVQYRRFLVLTLVI